MHVFGLTIDALIPYAHIAVSQCPNTSPFPVQDGAQVRRAPQAAAGDDSRVQRPVERPALRQRVRARVYAPVLVQGNTRKKNN